jgi:hypothetical protein
MIDYLEPKERAYENRFKKGNDMTNNNSEFKRSDVRSPAVNNSSGKSSIQTFDQQEQEEFDQSDSIDISMPRAHVRSKIYPGPYSILSNLQDLNGSWYIQFALAPDPSKGIVLLLHEIRGPMRIEAGPNVLLISGDIYVAPIISKPKLPDNYKPKANWCPHMPFKEYKWYFRSKGVKFDNGSLDFAFVRHLWDATKKKFTNSDSGWMKLQSFTAHFPKRTIVQMTGEAMIGGYIYNVTANKTSDFYRECRLEVDVMKNRNLVSSATSCDGLETFNIAGVYQEAGWDVNVVVSDINIPEDNLLTRADLAALMSKYRAISTIGHTWHVWLLVGSKDDNNPYDSSLGWIWDTKNPPYREGVVIFYDGTFTTDKTKWYYPKILSSIRGKKLGQVPLAFIRTLVHEVAHAFNLYHPKHDVHSVPTGTTIMNQTGDLFSQATTTNLFPCNAELEFNGHNRTSLIHSPDPQVAPGWMGFGWGHGSLFSGVSEPTDATGLGHNMSEANWARLTVNVPSEIFHGEIIIVTFTLANVGKIPQWVQTTLNLSEGYLRVRVTDPKGETVDIGDVFHIDGIPHMKELQPQESISKQAQILYTNKGYVFDQLGRYKVEVEFDLGGVNGTVARSAPVEITVRPPFSKEELNLSRLMMDETIGLSLSIGDIGTDPNVRERYETIMERFIFSNTGAACALVLTNSLLRDLQDILTGELLRRADEDAAVRALELTVRERTATELMTLATAVISPTDRTAPLLKLIQTQLQEAPPNRYEPEDIELALRILEDHLA